MSLRGIEHIYFIFYFLRADLKVDSGYGLRFLLVSDREGCLYQIEGRGRTAADG